MSLNVKFFIFFCFYGYMCMHSCHLVNCWVVTATETWGSITIFLFSLFLPNCALSESDITQESPFTSADTGNSRSAYPSYTGTGISTEGSSDFSWGYGVSCMLPVWWNAGRLFWELGSVTFVKYISFLHSMKIGSLHFNNSYQFLPSFSICFVLWIQWLILRNA